MVEELKLAIKIDDASIEQSLLKQFANAQKMARTFQSQGQDVNFKIKLHNSVQRQGKLVEGVTFTKGELTEFLRSL